MASQEVERRIKIMQFLASRRDEFFTPENITKIRSLRLFLVSHPSEAARFTDLSDASKKLVCLRNDPTAVRDHVPSLMALDLPDANVRHLSVPSEAFSALYQRIGVQTNFWTSDFVAQFVCGALPAAARRGFRHLQPMLKTVESWWDPVEDETLRTKLRDTVKAVAFVVTADGLAQVTAGCLVDPDLPVVQAFAAHLCDSLPSSGMRDFLPLLRRLGMKDSLPPDLVNRCALAFDGRVQQQEDSGAVLDKSMQKKSWLLLRALCRGYQDMPKSRRDANLSGLPRPSNEAAVVEAEAHLSAAAGLRIALVHPACYGVVEPVRYMRTLATTLTEPHSPRLCPDQPLLRLRSFRSLLMAPAVEALCWTQHGSLAQPAGSKGLSRLMEEVRQEISTQLRSDSELADALDLYCVPSKAPIKSVLKHLQYLAEQIAAVRDLQGVFSPRTHLMTELTSIYKILDERVTEISPDDVRSLRKMACVPIQIDRDASGDFGDASKVTLCFPERCFFKLPDRAEVELRGYLHLWPGVSSRNPIGKFTEIAKLLGVRQEPVVADLVWCIDAVGTSANGKELVPNEERAATFAMRSMLDMSGQSKSSITQALQLPLDLWLFVGPEDGKKRLVKSDSLVWIDRVDLEHRCGGLKEQLGLDFMCRSRQSGNNPMPWDGQQLCRLSSLRPLSSLVAEVLQETPGSLGEAGSPSEECFGALLMSAEFAAGSRACLKLSPEFADAHDKLLATLEIRWAACPLRSALCAENAGQRMTLIGSEITVLAFMEGNVLWLQSGILESSDAHQQLFDEVAMKLFRMLEGNDVPVTHHGHYPYMFACYKKGPTAIEAALKQRNVDPQAAIGQKQEPGKALDVIDHELLQQSTDFTFDEGELIAVSSAATDNHGVPQYHYARVLPYVEGPSRGPSGLPAR